MVRESNTRESCDLQNGQRMDPPFLGGRDLKQRATGWSGEKPGDIPGKTWGLLGDLNHYLWTNHMVVTTRYGTLAPMRPLRKNTGVNGVACRDTAAEDLCRYNCAGGSHNRAPARTDEELSALTDLISSINGLGSASGVAWRAICHRVSCGWMTTSCQPTGAGD